MKTISIKQLHHATGRYVRSAATEPLVVTDRGANVAVLKAFSSDDLPVRPFPVRSVADLPAVGIDSTTVISDDRDGRGFDSVYSHDRHFLAAAPHFGLQGHDIIR